MGKRILFGTVLLVTLLGIAAVDEALGRPILSVIAIFVMTAIAQREFLQMAGGHGGAALSLTWLATSMAFGMRWAGDRALGIGLSSSLLLLVVGLMFANLTWATFRLHRTGNPSRETIIGAVLSVFAFVYIALPLGFLQQLIIAEGVPFAALMVLCSKCGDMGGYLVGSKLGRHRVMPHVSPKKSWEGSLGGLLLTWAVVFGAQHYGAEPIKGWSLPMILGFGLAMNVATQMGDFTESMIKRCLAVKDSGDIVPTFGGALDILDSLIFAMPVAAIFVCGIS